MKKFVFISLILALAASVAFAQDEGSWSIGGRAEINTLFNFSNRDKPTTAEDDHISPQVGAGGYWMYDWWGEKPTAELAVTYSKGSLSAGIGFDITGKIGAKLNFDDGAFGFHAEYPLNSLFTGSYTDADRLWGSYKLMDGKIYLELAANSNDTNFWISSEAVGNVFDSAKINTGAVSMGWGFASVDHHNYLVANFLPIEGLEVGFMLPRVFTVGVGDTGKWDSGSIAIPGPKGYRAVNTNREYLYNAFQLIRFGAKYSTGPVEVAAQFAFTGDSGEGDDKGKNQAPPVAGLSAHNKKSDKPNTALYLGGKYGISDALSAELSIEANFSGLAKDRQKDGHKDNNFGAAVGFGYNAGLLNASLHGGLQFRNNYTKKAQKESAGAGSLLGVRPQISYQLVENYLCLSLNSFLFVDNSKDATKNQGIGYQLTPELWFNVAGTGASNNYWGTGPAIIVRYMVGGWTKNGGDPVTDPEWNALDITFKWNY
jgi:hypothetical protein